MNVTCYPKESHCDYSGQQVTSIVIDRIQQQITLAITILNNTKDCIT